MQSSAGRADRHRHRARLPADDRFRRQRRSRRGWEKYDKYRKLRECGLLDNNDVSTGAGRACVTVTQNRD